MFFEKILLIGGISLLAFVLELFMIVLFLFFFVLELFIFFFFVLSVYEFL